MIIYEPVLIARLDDGRIFLEVDRDIYGRPVGRRWMTGISRRACRIDNLIDWSGWGRSQDDRWYRARRDAEVRARTGKRADPMSDNR